MGFCDVASPTNERTLGCVPSSSRVGVSSPPNRSVANKRSVIHSASGKANSAAPAMIWHSVERLNSKPLWARMSCWR